MAPAASLTSLSFSSCLSFFFLSSPIGEVIISYILFSFPLILSLSLSRRALPFIFREIEGTIRELLPDPSFLLLLSLSLEKFLLVIFTSGFKSRFARKPVTGQRLGRICYFRVFRWNTR